MQRPAHSNSPGGVNQSDRLVAGVARAATLRRSHWAQSGFTLIEVLVAILVLSFGMLGVVGLQAAAMQANKDARYQSSAVRLGREYAEMMRANKAIAGVANNTYLINGTTAPATPPVNCFTTACGSGAAGQLNVAKYDISDWFARASQELPGLKADVCFDTTPYGADGRPQWPCTAPAIINRGQPAYVKLGWTIQNRAADGTTTAVVTRATDAGARPMVVVPVQLN